MFVQTPDLKIYCPRLMLVERLSVLTVTLTSSGLERIRRDPAGFAEGLIRFRQDTGQRLELATGGGFVLLLGYVCEAQSAIELLNEARKLQSCARAFLAMDSVIVADEFRTLPLQACG